MFKHLMLGLLAFFLISGLTWAEDKPTEESQVKEKIIAVIDAQLEAFQSGDAEKAYSFATPGIQRQFPNSSIFMQMVMNGYNVLRQPTQVEYRDLRDHFGVKVGKAQKRELQSDHFGVKVGKSKDRKEMSDHFSTGGKAKEHSEDDVAVSFKKKKSWRQNFIGERFRIFSRDPNHKKKKAVKKEKRKRRDHFGRKKRDLDQPQSPRGQNDLFQGGVLPKMKDLR